MEILINGENAMAMLEIKELKSDPGGVIHGIFVATGRTKAAVTENGNKLKVTAWGQEYRASPKEESSPFNILLILSISVFLGWRVYIVGKSNKRKPLTPHD